MKKFITTLLLMALLLSPFLDVQAGKGESGQDGNTVSAEDRVLLQTGYTDSGIYYEVFGRAGSTVLYAATVAVEREVVFYGRVVPERTMNWEEIISGKTFTGTLKLHSYTYNVAADITTAYYRGDISAG